MSDYSVKSIRKKFAENGVFYTDIALAQLLKTYMPDDLTEIYDPTCGSGNLLSVFADEVVKYGQELDPQQAEVAAQRLPNSHIVAGDTLKAPAFREKRFRGIVANYPFSVRWEPDESDERFCVAPCTAPQSRADWAFLLHILYMLEDGGVAATLNYPGAFYRQQREQKIRGWFVEQGYIHEVAAIPGGHFVDTPSETVLVIIRKAPTDSILFRTTDGYERRVPVEEVRAAGYTLAVSHYVTAPEPEKPPVDIYALEQEARAAALRRIEAEIKFSLMAAELEGWDASDFIEDIIRIANSYRKQPTLFP